MANQDRIKKAKEELTEWVEMHSGMVPSEDLNAFEEEVKDRQWFIEQAEKVERYEKALDDIRCFDDYNKTEYAIIKHIHKLANEALNDK